jgi:hypothetical protein
MIENIMFAMSKEFGWTPDQILELDYKHFNMYAKQLNEYYKANEAASKGKRYVPDISIDEKEKNRKRALLNKWSGSKNGSNLHESRCHS